MIETKYISVGIGEPIRINQISEAGYRLVHNDKEVITTINGTAQSVTLTRSKAEEFVTEKEMLDRISSLKLTAVTGGQYENKKG